VVDFKIEGLLVSFVELEISIGINLLQFDSY